MVSRLMMTLGRDIVSRRYYPPMSSLNDKDKRLEEMSIEGLPCVQ